MKAGKKAAIALAGAAMLVMVAAVPANAAYSSSGGAFSCAAPRTVGTYSSGGTGGGNVYHSQQRAGITYSKSWENTAPTYRYFSKGFPDIQAWYVSTDAIATNRGVTCMT